MKPPADILIALATMVERHRLNGGAFADACRREQFRRGRLMPDPVHHVVDLIGDAGRDLTPAGGAAVLRGAAGRLDEGGDKGGGTWPRRTAPAARTTSGGGPVGGGSSPAARP